ncbi:MAG: hypothetical protein GXP14_07375 [Gammaproteobacteria bacterium]|nr:hypothetical protein [Gammaproteobacteria bacterium]
MKYNTGLMPKDLKIGVKFRDKEERLWQGRKYSNFVPSSGIGKTYMLQVWVFKLWVNASEAKNGRTRLFNVNIEIEI